MNLPRKRATPRRKAHPIRPPWEQPEVHPDPFPGKDTFRDRVLDATSPRGICVGTPGCLWPGPHQGDQAHHRHVKGNGGRGGGTNATSNGAWLCDAGHKWVHRNIEAARALDLIRSWSEPYDGT